MHLVAYAEGGQEQFVLEMASIRECCADTIFKNILLD